MRQNKIRVLDLEQQSTIGAQWGQEIAKGLKRVKGTKRKLK